MKYIALKELQKYIIHDGCDKGCGYIDERDLSDIPTVDMLDNIRAEIEQLPITDTAVRLVTAVLDKYKVESEDKNEQTNR